MAAKSNENGDSSKIPPEPAPDKNRERYASEHPAGYLASRARPPATEKGGHPLDRDQPGYGPAGGRVLGDGERELTLATPLPDVARRSKPPAADAEQAEQELGEDEANDGARS